MLAVCFWIWVGTGWVLMMLFALVEVPKDGQKATFWQQVTYGVGATFFVVSMGMMGYIFLIGLKNFLPTVL